MTFGSFLPVQAMLATALARNVAVLFPALNVTGQRVLGSVVILILMVANIRGVKMGSLIMNFFTVGKLTALGLVIVGGLVVMKGANFTTSVTPTVEWGNAFTAAVPALLAFGGYYTLSYMSGEIDNPKRNLPLATVFGMGIVILVNVTLNISSIGSVGFSKLAGAETPVSDAAQVIFGPIGAIIVTLGAIISIFGSLNGSVMSSPRVDYAMSQDGLIFGFFGKLHPKFQTPYITLLTFGALSIAFLWTGTFMTLLMMGVFVSRSLECFVALSLIVLRKKQPHAERPLKMWGYPISTVIAIAITAFLVSRVNPIQIRNGAILMLSSIPAYFIFKLTLKNRNTTKEENAG
jgi:APA family basic amino acid/polyamine antiporter